jgi:hypothetical protein
MARRIYNGGADPSGTRGPPAPSDCAVAGDDIHALDAESVRDVAIVSCYQDAFPSGAD